MRNLSASRFVRATVSMAIVGVLAACSSTTTIRSSDPAAKIFVDGELKGTGTAVHTDTKIVGSRTEVRLEKPGCQPQNFSFSRTEEFDIGACVGGAFLTIPFLWIMKYKPSRTFEYSCAK